MPVQTVYALGESQVSVSGGGQLSGVTQGDGSHLDGLFLTLNSNAWESILIDDDDTNFADNDGSQRLEGTQTFDGVSYNDNLKVEAEFGITVQTPDGTIYQLYAFNINQGGGGNPFGSVEGLAFDDTGNGFPPIGVPLEVINTAEGPQSPYTTLATPPCFVPGTLIKTPAGAVDVVELRAGDMVETMDDGPQAIRWIGWTQVPSDVLQDQERFRPIRIARHAFGHGRPRRDMLVSPQHRVLVRDWRAEMYFGVPEILVPAVKLCNGTTVQRVHDLAPVTYIHMLFDRHQIVYSDGLPSESFFPGADDYTTMAQEIRALFPGEFGRLSNEPMARACMSDKRARSLAP